ncbi:glycosyltransferase family 2 protein [Salegentibacter salegens]|uniref:Glycosyltransferase involved in cell wall bisynthesis n=1 Tax=Salegentibacter salegens TaxID=143223 RepID=A0A1M7NEH7_9FLAO|nr:glycosyltransferase family 2 protein [Salegentibacter salegens]PRX46300.1 glycosyltransferase involved in cell wall biosynthesis [Salegentibacter salegens]SHN02085.1 Glycosyltransferase involved in cell wall bisynthesis [Salegentibacter salegens]
MLKESEPTVTIILATYNRVKVIGKMLDSIKDQTFKNWECLIIDDGSSDNTEQIVSSHIKNDERFIYLNRPEAYRRGLPGSRNYGLDKAKGDYLIFFDDDDIAHPRNLEICLNGLLNSDNDFFHYCKKSFTTTFPKYREIAGPIDHYEIGSNQFEKVVTNKIALASCTVMWSKKCFVNIRFNESLNYAEEWECYTRILLAGYKGVGIDEILYFNRKHQASNTGEFWKGDKKRRASNEKAIELVIEDLQNKDLLSKYLIRHFVQMSVFLKNKTILEHVLAKSNMAIIEKLKYRFFYKCYPVLVLGHRTKKLLKK